VVKRRTLGDGLNHEEEEFLHGKTKNQAKSKPKEQKETETMRQSALKKDFPAATPITNAPPPQLQTGMTGLNTRVEPAISAALLCASVDRKIQRKARAAMQDIVNEALSEWLKKQGYLN
jgi:hypothetical protein